MHEVLDSLDWTVKDLAIRVGESLGRKISRSSMQGWATGTRQIGAKGESRSHAVQAPLDVRQAAQVLTQRDAAAKGIGAVGVLLVDEWPNVEAE